MPKYLYCVAKEIEPNFLNTAGIEDAPVHVIHSTGLSCVVSDSDLADKELSKESALAHEKVLEEVMQYSPIVPIAFGHVAKSEDEIKTKLLEANRSKLEEWLARLQGKIELSVKAFWLDVNPVLRRIADTNDEIKHMKSRGTLTRDEQMRAGEIAAKLMGKKREDAENGLITYFKDIALEHKTCNIFGEQMITNLAFLINEHNLRAFDKKMNEYEEYVGDENIRFKYTGPVPPYNFVELHVNLT
jgi:hypothetical protein